MKIEIISRPTGTYTKERYTPNYRQQRTFQIPVIEKYVKKQGVTESRKRPWG